MKVQIMSDLHLEFHQDRGKQFISQMNPKGKADVLILAGDVITPYYAAEPVYNEICKRYNKVILVLGNHEYYGSSFGQVNNHYKSVLANKFENLHILDKNVIELGRQRFVGSTLWFPDDALNVLYARNLSDFSQIKDFAKLVYDENKQAVSFLNRNMNGNDVVITHHLPSYGCVNWKYRHGPASVLNRFFVCEMRAVIEKNCPKLWIFGHGHDYGKMKMFGTELICNPLGYPGEASNFKDNLIVDV